MWHRIIALVVKELLTSLRDRKTRNVVLIAPPFLLLVYAFAVTLELTNADIAILNRDTGAEARELVSRFAGSPSFGRVLYLSDVSQIAPVVDDKQAAMVVQLAPDFSRRVLAGEPAVVQILLDGRRSNAAQILFSYASRIVLTYGAERSAARGQRLPSIVTTRAWFNPNVEPLWSAVPALFAVMAAIVGFMVSVLAIAREREMGTFDQLLVSPLRLIEILAGKTLPALVLAMISATATLFLATVVLGVPLRGSVPAFYLAMVFYQSANIGIGLFISSLAATQQQAVIGLFTYMAPAVMLSGYATPVENMPDWLQALAQVNPITHFIIISKGLFLKDMPPGVVFAHIWPMAVFALVALAAGALMFRSKLA